MMWFKVRPLGSSMWWLKTFLAQLFLLYLISLPPSYSQYASQRPPRTPINNRDPLPIRTTEPDSVSAEIDALNKQLEASTRSLAIIRARISIIQGVYTEQYGEIEAAGYAIAGAGNFVFVGSDLAGIPSAITMSSGSSDNTNSQQCHSVKAGRRSKIRVKRHCHDHSSNDNGENQSVLPADCMAALTSGNSSTLDQCMQNAALAPLIVTAVGTAILGSGDSLQAIGYLPLVARGDLEQALTGNDLRLALYSTAISRRVQELNKEVPQSPDPARRSIVTASQLGPVEPEAPTQSPVTFPEFFYGTWQAVSDEPTLDERFWKLTAALTSQLIYKSDRLKQSVHRIEITSTSLVTYLETTSDTGQILLSITASPQVKFRYVLKSGVGSQLNAPPTSIKRLSVDAIDTLGIFLGWDDEPVWEWYRYNKSNDSLVDINHQHVFQRQ